MESLTTAIEATAGLQALLWNLFPTGQCQTFAIVLAIVELEGRSDEAIKAYYSKHPSQKICPNQLGSVGELPLHLEIPLPDLIDRRVDHQLQQERGEDPADQRRRDPLHDVRPGSHGPHDGDES